MVTSLGAPKECQLYKYSFYTCFYDEGADQHEMKLVARVVLPQLDVQGLHHAPDPKLGRGIGNPETIYYLFDRNASSFSWLRKILIRIHPI